MTRRNAVFACAVAGLVAVVTGSVLVVAVAPRHEAPSPSRRVFHARSLIAAPFVMFRTLAPPVAYGRIAMAPGRDPESARFLTLLSCARVHYAGEIGVCLVEELTHSGVRHFATLFDETFRRSPRIALAGMPIRARVSPDGRWAAVTTYAEQETPDGERLAMESVLIDVRAGRVLANLREFFVAAPVGATIPAPHDISSLAFTQDGDRFFATLSAATERYLVSGSVAGRQLTVVAVGVANEALSPDGTRLIVKKRVGEGGYWQLAVLDLDTMRERVLNQGARSVDDQVEWMDDGHVVFHDASGESTGIWSLATDTTAGPRLLIGDAISPTVVHSRARAR